jgi:hypothetical protein
MIMNISRNVTVSTCTLNILIWFNLNWNVHAKIKMEEQLE